MVMQVPAARLHGWSGRCRWFSFHSCRKGRLDLIVVRCPCRPDERHAAASFIPNGGRGDIMVETERPDDLQAELQRLRRRVAELEAAQQQAAPAVAPPP